MIDTKIEVGGKTVAGYDIIPPVPVNSDNIDEQLNEPLNELYNVSEKLNKALNFMDVEFKSGDIAYLANGIVKEGTYGGKYIDSISGGFQRTLLEYIDNAASPKKVSYSIEVIVNKVQLDATFTYKNKQSFIVEVTDFGNFTVYSDQVSLTNTRFKDGDEITIKLTYSSDCKIPVLTDGDVNKTYLTGLSDLNKVKSIKGNTYNALIPEIKLVTDTWVSKYIRWTFDCFSECHIVTPEASLIEGQSSIRLPLDKYRYLYNDTDYLSNRRVINRLGVLPDGFNIIYRAYDDGVPDINSNEIIEFTWGEIPGTFKIENRTGFVSPKHTLVKNFDKFEPNTKYVIWIRSCIVFAFKAEPDGNLSIS